MKTLLITILLLQTGTAFCQKETLRGFTVYNSQPALPFSRFKSLLTGIKHPGLEIFQRKIFKQRKKYAMFWDVKASVFYHRFVQWGIPVSANVGYKYKLLHDLSFDVSLGGGYLHSIPATEKLKLDEQGLYKSNKGIGRAQANVNAGFAMNFTVNPLSERRHEVFIGYNQMMQLPFIKSYVPLLPYNQLLFGVRKKIK